MIQNSTQLLRYDGSPKEIQELDDLRKLIKDFKDEKALPILLKYYGNWKYKKNAETFPRFMPKRDPTPENRNIGVFSTAVCLQVIALYNTEKINTRNENVKKKIEEINQNKSKIAEFIIKALDGSFAPFDDAPNSGIIPGLLPNINTLVRFKNYIDHSRIEELFTGNNIKIISRICLKNTLEFYDQLKAKKESIHPYILYKFLQFLKSWEEEIKDSFTKDPKEFNVAEVANDNKHKENYAYLKSKCTPAESEKENIYEYFLDEIYFLAKYELYRQMGLKLSGDSALYDVKRLIYSVLIVSMENKFSNNLVINQALKLIFELQSNNAIAVWPTGQVLPMNVDSATSVSSMECVFDLLESDAFFQNLNNYLSQLKGIFDFCAQTIQYNNKREPIGWYPLDQRDKTPTSWTTAFVLGFIKRFCKFLSFKISGTVRETLHMNLRKPSIEWNDLYDSTSVKSKLLLMFDEKEESEGKLIKKSTAILFGPPGIGKTTYARALATKLKWDFFELTPGDFFSGGEGAILTRINKVFENLLHLEKAVVFIDEIDDLVRAREKTNAGFDPRTLYVNTLLPRFQELHDRGNIILIMATNHFEDVDQAIARLGRVDLIIPVGPLSIHGRLKLIYGKYKEQLPKVLSEKQDVLETYLENTQNLNLSQVRVYLDEIANSGQFTQDGLINVKDSMKDALDIKPFKELKDNIRKYRTRPESIHDFYDYEDIHQHIKVDDLISVYLMLQTGSGLALNKDKIAAIISECIRKEYFNIITPFYDDIKKALIFDSNDAVKKALSELEKRITKRRII